LHEAKQGIKPVQFLSSVTASPTYLMLNEICGFWIACSIIKINPALVHPKHLENILYLLHYCDPTAEALFTILEPLPYLYGRARE